MENDEEKSKIDELKKRLNSRSFSSTENSDRKILPKKEVDETRRDWPKEDKEVQNASHPLESMVIKRKRNFLKTFLLGSIVFFVIALTIMLFTLFGGRNIISSDNVDISVSGPTSISGGETLSLDIIVSNGNNTDLELADLIIEYPEGTRSANNLSIDLPRDRFSLGDVPAGRKVNQKIEAILFGEEGGREKIKITVEYRVAGSNAIFFKEREYEIEISSSPVSFSIDSLTDVNSGKEVSFIVKLKSNSTNLLEDLLFIAEYPFGFIFESSEPRTSFEQNIWKMGDLSPGEEREIKITGILEGQDGEERVFRFFSGIESEKNEKELEVAFVSAVRSVFIKKPFLALDIVIDGNTSLNYNTSVGKLVSVNILWKNNLPTSIANVEIDALFSGDVNESSVKVDRGFYNSVENTAVWSQERNPAFGSISPGQDGSVKLTFRSPDFTGGTMVNPEATIDVSVRGRRLSETGVSEEVVSSVKRSVRFNTNPTLLPRAVHFSGPISNTGPIPPKAEEETTYTIIWTLSNTVNRMSDVVVSARLPSYVRWTNQTSGGAEDITYNSVSRQVFWDVGTLSSNTGFSTSPREVAFQIAVVPSLSQVGETPLVIGDTMLTGKDDFTGVIIEGSKSGLTTKTSTDTGYKFGDEVVIE